MSMSICVKRVGNCSSSTAAAIIGGNEDMLAQILVLLPAKTVVRFKSVSKQWLSLISSEFFTRLHVQKHGRHGCRGRLERQHSFIMSDVHGRAKLFICHHTIKKLLRISMPSPIKQQAPFKHFEILQSWNGLLLISIKFLGEDRNDYVVFNPTTKHYRLLQLDGYRPLYICLMFDPSKPECYKVFMVTVLTPMKYSVYDSATQEWSHDLEGGKPFTKGHLLGFRISSKHLINLRNRSKILRDTTVVDFPEKSIYSVQLEPLPEENKLRFRIRERIHGEWAFDETRTVDFNFKNSSTGVRLLAIMLEDGAKLKDVVVLFHVPGQLLIYKISQGIKVLVDYRSDYFYVEDECQFEDAHPFIHTFTPV